MGVWVQVLNWGFATFWFKVLGLGFSRSCFNLTVPGGPRKV